MNEKENDKSASNTADYESIPRPTTPEFDFPLTQLPNPTPEYSPEYSQSPFRGSQYCPSQKHDCNSNVSQNIASQGDTGGNRLDFWSQEKISFNFDECSQAGCSQSRCSQFYCSQVDEIAFCSQANPVEYNPKVYPLDSYTCVPMYRASIIAEVRAADLKLTPTDSILEAQNQALNICNTTSDIFCKASINSDGKSENNENNNMSNVSGLKNEVNHSIYQSEVHLNDDYNTITASDREAMIVWMIDNMVQLEVSSRALFLAVRLFDRSLTKIKMDKETIMKYTIACLSLGAKFENSFAQSVSNYAESSQKFTEDEIINSEKDILLAFNFELNQPTEIFFLKIWLNSVCGDNDLAMTVVFVGFCSFFNITVRTELAEVVAAAVFRIAVNACGNKKYCLSVLNETIELYGETRIKSCEEAIVDTIGQIVSDENSTLRCMFAMPERGSVATKYNYEVSK
ncbi:hypothetical protein TRFO_33976 [Tritrichomonas foetus]|uniref:Cyclin-like domain-containing protein n=1 Tax=Tritrichomonas foetus TaxID=1144522 RepID=A0A1J4JK95_9EUKA|nr:hypothetical protein TRFO_33976 [Tritrichomonas foetus]|eukprot:OHS99560.1 hypothetical protein TRFO_33976 [Tritrichomonas foetus]